MSPRPSLARVPQKARRREIIPAPIHEAVVSFARLLTEFFGSALAGNSRLKYSVGRLLTAQLPPLSRPRGRPGFELVSRAIRLRAKLQRRHPEISPKKIWRVVYMSLIPNYDGLPRHERRGPANELRQRVLWRLKARRRRQRERQLKQNLSCL
jgi:hypothetical protein